MALYPHPDRNLIILLSVIKVCLSFEFCREESIYSLTDYYIYCEYDCCGYAYNRYCCENYSGVIAGAVVGSLLFLGLVVGVILCFVKKKGHQGAVIGPSTVNTNPAQHTSVAFVTSTQIQQSYTQPPPAYGVAPAYQTTYNYPPVYNAAYPPPPAYPHDPTAPRNTMEGPVQRWGVIPQIPPIDP